MDIAVALISGINRSNTFCNVLISKYACEVHHLRVD